MFHFKVAIWIVLSGIFFGTQAALKNYYVDDLCYFAETATIRMGSGESGILIALPNKNPISCEIRLVPYAGNSIVLSINRYQLDPADKLIIEDSDRYKIALLGYGYFSDERKSIISDGSLTVYYQRNSTENSRSNMFQFTITHASSMPCGYNRYQCRNKRCVSLDLVCNGHNHCGDRSDQDTCAPKRDKNISVKTGGERVSPMNTSMIITIVMTIVASLVFVGIIGCLVCICTRKGKEKGATLPTVASAVPMSNASPQPNPTQSTPSVFGQIRRSFRNLRNPKPEVHKAEEQKPENYQVPSMYPQIPSAPDMAGIANTNFQGEE